MKESNLTAITARDLHSIDFVRVVDGDKSRKITVTDFLSALALQNKFVEILGDTMHGNLVITSTESPNLTITGEATTDASITLTSALNTQSVINFGDAVVTNSGQIKYDNVLDKLTLTVNSLEGLTIDNAQGVSVPGTLTVTGDSSLSTVTTSGLATLNSATVSTTLGVTGTSTLSTVSATGNITPSVTNTIDIGAVGSVFANVHATTFHGEATSAQYADLAERFEADTVIIPGTVVELGGNKEVTVAKDELSEEVFGVVSTAPAYLMNAGAGTDDTHPSIAMSGRVPVRVIGLINKGNRLVSAGNGLARAAEKQEINAFNVIGRALEDKTTTGEGTIEAFVTVN